MSPGQHLLHALASLGFGAVVGGGEADGVGPQTGSTQGEWQPDEEHHYKTS